MDVLNASPEEYLGIARVYHGNYSERAKYSKQCSKRNKHDSGEDSGTYKNVLYTVDIICLHKYLCRTRRVKQTVFK